MRKDYIMSEEDKVMKRKKIELNRAKKRPSTEKSVPERETREESMEPEADQGLSMSSVQDGASAAKLRKLWHLPQQNYKETEHRHMSEPFPSPTSAASIPSPSSPPDSATVASKTLEMLSGAISVITSPVLPLRSLSHPCPNDHDASVILHHRSREPQVPENNDTPLLSSLISSARTEEISPETYLPPAVSVIQKEPSRRSSSDVRENSPTEIIQDVQR